MKKHSRKISVILLAVLLAMMPFSSLADEAIPEEIELWETTEAYSLTLRGPEEAVSAGHTCELIASFLSKAAVDGDVTFWKDGEQFATATLEDGAATVEYSTVEVGDHEFRATLAVGGETVRSNRFTVTIAPYGEDDGSSLTLDDAGDILGIIPTGEEDTDVTDEEDTDGDMPTEEEILAQARSIIGENVEYEVFAPGGPTLGNFSTSAGDNNHTVSYGESITVRSSVSYNNRRSIWLAIVDADDTIIAEYPNEITDSRTKTFRNLTLDVGVYRVACINGNKDILAYGGSFKVEKVLAKAESITSVGGTSIAYGSALDFVVQMSKAGNSANYPYGAVHVTLDGHHYTADVDAATGIASFHIDTRLPSHNNDLPNPYKPTAAFTFQPHTTEKNYQMNVVGSLDLTVIEADTDATLSIAYDNAETAKITATVARVPSGDTSPAAIPTGYVALYSADNENEPIAGPVFLDNGAYTFEIPLNTINGQQVFVKYHGSQNRFAPDQSPNYPIDQFATRVSIACPETLVYGQYTPVTVQVTAYRGNNGTAYSPKTGTVSLYQGNTLIAKDVAVQDGAAAFTLDSLAHLGAPDAIYTLTARYSGTAFIQGGDAAARVALEKAAPLVKTSHTGNWSQGYTLSATFEYGANGANRVGGEETPAGTAALLVATDGENFSLKQTAPIENGKVSFHYTPSLFGATWRVDYGGDDFYKTGKASDVTGEVISGVDFTANKTTLTYPEKVSLKVIVSPRMLRGSYVNLYDNGIAFKGDREYDVANGRADIVWQPAVGTHTLTAEYLDYEQLSERYIAPRKIEITVNKAQPTVTLATSRSYTDGSVTLTATVSGVTGGDTPTGNVRFTHSNGTRILDDVALVNGKATLTIAASQQNLPTAAFTATAAYLGNGNYTTATDNETVGARMIPIIVTASPEPTATPRSTKKAAATATPAPTAKASVSSSGSLVNIQDSGVPLAAPAASGDSTIRLLDELGKQLETYASKMLVDSVGVLAVETQAQRTQYTYEIRLDEMRAFGTQYPDGYYDIMADGIAVSLPFALYDGFPGLSDYLREVKLSRNTLRLRATLEQVDSTTPQEALQDSSVSANLESPVWRLTLTLHDALGNKLDYSPSDALTVPIDLRFATREEDAFGLMYNPATQVMALQEAMRREGEAIISAVHNGDYGLVIDKGMG